MLQHEKPTHIKTLNCDGSVTLSSFEPGFLSKIPVTDNEMWANFLAHFVAPECVDDFVRIKSLRRLTNAVFYCYRFLIKHRLRKKNRPMVMSNFSNQDLDSAESFLLRLAQCNRYNGTVQRTNKSASKV